MSALIPYTNLSVVTQQQIAQRDPITAVKPTDQTVNNSATFVNDSALAVSVAANATYQIECYLIYNSNSTANFKCMWTTPAGVSGLWTVAAPAVGNAITAPFLGTITWGGTAGLAGFASDMFAHISGLLVVGATPGTLQLQWAQNTANASNTIVRAFSALIARQVA